VGCVPTGYRLPATGYRLPATGYRLPRENYESHKSARIHSWGFAWFVVFFLLCRPATLKGTLKNPMLNTFHERNTTPARATPDNAGQFRDRKKAVDAWRADLW